MTELIFDDDFKKAHDLLLFSDENIFLTGNAGTGKSSLLSLLMTKWKKNVVLLAPTGVAALNIGGETIHSFFGFKPAITQDEVLEIASKLRLKKREFFTKIDVMVIDEISMVRADLLDFVDLFLKTALHSKKPFGGLRMIFIGDLYQLPPVVTSEEKEIFLQKYSSPYFFSSHVMQNTDFDLTFVELEKIYRQHDTEFIEILNAIRKNSATDMQLAKLNQRVLNTFSDEGYLYLTTTNAASQKINDQKLEKLPGDTFEFTAEIEGDFDPKNAPTEKILKLKKNAQVMLLTNHPHNDWVNGSVGRILSIEDTVKVELTSGEIVEVKPFAWSMYRYNFDEKTQKIEPKEIGSFLQLPLKLSWAITIHKSQGKTFDKVIVDLEKGAFAHGQIYVALSRCKTFENLILKKPIQKKHIFMDRDVVNFLIKFQYAASKKKFTIEDKRFLIETAIAKRQKLLITYLKATDEKSKRVILPKSFGPMTYEEKNFFGLEAYCFKRKETRVFNIEKILEISFVVE